MIPEVWNRLFETQITESFTWTDNSDGSQWHFAVTAINRYIDENPGKLERVCLVIDHPTYAAAMGNGVEQWKLDRMDAASATRPILVAAYDETTHLLIDGNHRVATRWRAGIHEVGAYMLPRSFWYPIYGYRL